MRLIVISGVEPLIEDLTGLYGASAHSSLYNVSDFHEAALWTKGAATTRYNPNSVRA